MTNRLRRSSVSVLTAACLGGLLVGCGGGNSASGKSSSTTRSHTPSTTSSAPSTTSSAPTSATASSNATYAGAPGVPDEAKYKTDAGAIAFAKHYLKTVNKVGQEPKVGVLEPLALPSCKTCAAQQKTTADDVTKRHRTTGDQFKIISAHRVAAEGSVQINVLCTQPAITVIDEKGKAVETVDPRTKPFGMVFELSWVDGWRAKTIRLDERGEL